MKKLISIFLAILMIVSLFTTAVYAGVGDNEFYEKESNDSTSTADKIGKDYTVGGSITGENDMDFFKFTLSSKSNVTILCSSSYSTLLIGICDSKEEVIAAAGSSYDSDTGSYISVLEKTLSAGTYYILVLQDSSYSKITYAFYFDYTTSSSHTHSYSKTVTKPTCTTGGYTTYKCSCGDSYEADYTSAVGHTESGWITDTAPTCIAEGTQHKECSVCKEITTTKKIAKSDHTYSDWEIIIEPSCTVQGRQKRYCLVCSVVEEVDMELSAGHNNIVTIDKATTSADGQIKSECTECGNSTVEIIGKISTISLSSEKVVYNGKVRTPSVSVYDASGVALVEGTNYTVTYAAGRNLPGVYNIKVVFTGNYEGEENLKFTIAPKAATGVKAKTVTSSSITLEWSKATGTTGYRVYQYSPSKGEYVLKKSLTGNSYKVTGLKGNTTYKFKIRSYAKTADGTVVWGEDSSVLSTKTKSAYSVKLSTDSATLYVGGSKTLKATPKPSSKTITWKSSDKSIATVSSSGKVTAVKKGTVTITAYFKVDGTTYKDTCKVTVKKPTISLSKTSATITVYDKLTLKATTTPSDVTVKWTSSNTKIAKVSSSGKVTPVKAGTANITASFVYAGKTYKSVCKVTVKKQDVITVDKVDWYINSAGGVEPWIKITNNTNKDIKYIVLETEYRNKFGDPAYCEIEYDFTCNLRVTSGLKAKSTDTFYWDPVIYNYNVHRVDINRATITFVDGTEVTQDVYWYWYDSEYYY